MHADCSVLGSWPESHIMHSEEPIGAYVCGAHAVHCVPLEACFPDSHAVHRSESKVAIDPASHGSHDEDAAGATWPGAHLKHCVPLGA